MGEAKRRKAEIEELKRRSPEEAAQYRHYLQLQDDKHRIAFGINPESTDIEVPAAMARTLSATQRTPVVVRR